jgi:hypothetical protein
LLDLSCTYTALRAACLPLLFENIVCAAYKYDTHASHGARGHATLFQSLSSSSCLGQHIRTLRTKCLSLDDRTAEQILEFTPRLESLIYIFPHDHYWDSDIACMDTRRLSNALVHVKSTLKHLKIGYRLTSLRPRGPKSRPTHLVQNAGCSLRHLIALESLRVPLTILLGWQLEAALATMLPPSLVTLHFTRIPQRQWEQLPKVEPMAVVLKPFVEGGK